MPPCPGNKAEESLTPASLLNHDSTKSPVCPTIPITIPNKNTSNNETGKILKYLTNTNVNTLPITQATAPSILLLGDTFS